MAGNTPKQRVVDASFVLAYLLPDERAQAVDRAFGDYQGGAVDFISCTLLPFEVLNGLRSAVVQKRLEETRARRLSNAFLSLGIELVPVDYHQVVRLALKLNITVYDAGYVWLARHKRIPLLTLDASLPVQ